MDNKLKKSNITLLKEEIYLMKLENFDEIKRLKGILEIDKDISLNEEPEKEKIPFFIGCLVSDKAGKTLLTFEVFEGALELYLKKDIDDDRKKKFFDITLIAMFISAIEKFSEEINIQDLSGLNLKGIRLKIQIFRFDKYNIIFFLNPNINFKFVEKEVNSFFINLIDENEENFEHFVNFGKILNVYHLEKVGREWLEDLNRIYEQKIINLEIFDFDSVKTLYSKLKGLYDKINLDFFVILEKMKKMKINLSDAIQKDRFDEIKTIAEKIQDINLILEINNDLID